MASETYTQSYTVADIGKVIDQFAADFDMAHQSTGLRTREDVRMTTGDVKRMAERGFLSAVNLYLQDGNGRIPVATKYEVSTNGGALTASRPGNMLWPRTPGGTLALLVEYSPAWWGLPENKKAEFKKELKVQWGTSNIDPSFPGLSRSVDRSYVSNGYALNKSVYK